MTAFTVIALHCPSCVTATESDLADGARAGATVLLILAAMVIAGVARFAWRITRSPQTS